MAEKLPPEKFWQLYKSLPLELKDALFAEETGNNIDEICKRNGVQEKFEDIVDYTGRVLLGILPPGDFQKILQKDLKIELTTAQKVYQQINRYIFYPVKKSLEEIYKTTLVQPEKTAEIPEINAAKENATKREKNAKEDTYREQVE